MGRKLWTINLPEGTHAVEVEHGWFLGTRNILVDGRPLDQTQTVREGFLRRISHHPFMIEGHHCLVQVYPSGLNLTHDLIVDGRSVETGKEVVTRFSPPAGVSMEEHVQAITVQGYAQMQQAIRSWGRWSLILAALHFVGGSVLNASWGALLILVALASFYFREAAMFVVYGTTLGWAAISNLIASSTGWLILALLQIYWTGQIFGDFFKFRGITSALEKMPPEARQVQPAAGRAAGLFPGLGLLFGLLACLGTILLLGTVFLAVISRAPDLPPATGARIAFVIDLAVLGVAFGLSAILSRFPGKIVAVVGVACSAIPLFLAFALMVLTGRATGDR